MADLTTSDNVKEYLAIDDFESDGQIGRLISAASQRFIALSGNPILQANYTDVRDGNGTRYLLPQQSWVRYPLQSVQSVVIDDTPIPPRLTMDDNGWSVVDGRIELVGYVFTSTRVTSYFGIAAYPGFGGLSAGTGNITVQYTAGYATVPPEVEQAVIEMVAWDFKARDRVAQRSKSVGNEVITFMVDDVPPTAMAVINQYTRVVL